jgi:hypothetical protein
MAASRQPGSQSVWTSATLADVDDFALVWLELDQAGEAACDRLELG